MHKIMITGNACAGKTTLSYRVAKILHREDIVSLDKVVWKSGWRLVDKEKKELALSKIITMPTWIVEGVSQTVIEAADTIIFLDYPRYVCYWRAVKRTGHYRLKSRPELPEKCPEIGVIGKLAKIIWNFPRLIKPNILTHINENLHNKTIFHITNDNELEAMIGELTSMANRNNGSRQ